MLLERRLKMGIEPMPWVQGQPALQNETLIRRPKETSGLPCEYNPHALMLTLPAPLLPDICTIVSLEWPPPGMFNPQPKGCMRPRILVNVAQDKTANLLKILKNWGWGVLITWLCGFQSWVTLETRLRGRVQVPKRMCRAGGGTGRWTRSEG